MVSKQSPREVWTISTKEGDQLWETLQLMVGTNTYMQGPREWKPYICNITYWKSSDGSVLRQVPRNAAGSDPAIEMYVIFKYAQIYNAINAIYRNK